MKTRLRACSDVTVLHLKPPSAQHVPRRSPLDQKGVNPIPCEDGQELTLLQGCPAKQVHIVVLVLQLIALGVAIVVLLIALAPVIEV